ncbi:DUF4446 family protein [Ferviditalea candida]|uniref:DUF4446 family protein n=1 Tax=Ferviditalea candida TaxID=3108399 RepID=A0ABU5ZL33_9BACL|nr:DUF4446 family protein [Paenibacillaceae bacterium T2]
MNLADIGVWPVFALAAVVLILFIIVMVIGADLRRIKKKYNKMINGNGVPDLEQILADLQNKMNQYRDAQQKQQHTIDMILSKLKQMTSYVSVNRYNAFHEPGNDLSFSIAIVNESRSGLVLTGIHNREDTRIYAKPLENGESKYILSLEEKEVVNQALKKTLSAASLR